MNEKMPYGVVRATRGIATKKYGTKQVLYIATEDLQRHFAPKSDDEREETHCSRLPSHPFLTDDGDGE